MLMSYMVSASGNTFECLFPDDRHRSDAADLGFVHFISLAKKNPAVARLLQDHFQKAYPRQYEVCCRLDRDLPLNS